MARFPQSSKKTLRVAEVLADHGSALGSLLKHASLLMQMEHLLAGFLDPELAAHFQVATIRENRLILISPSASWATLLRMQVPQLVESLHQAGYAGIAFIDIRVAPLVEQPGEFRKRKPLSPAAQQALDQMALLEADIEE
jgi:hypothetical protein